MSVQVALVDNPLKNGGKIIPRVVSGRTVGFDDILEFMAKDTALECNDMRATFQQFIEALVFFLPQGNGVATPIGTFRLGVRSRGSDEDGIAVDRSGIHLRLRADSSVTDRLRSASSVETVDAPSTPLPVIKSIRNIDTGNGASEFSAGNIMHLEGSRLSFDREDAEQGVFLVSGNGKSQARCTIYSRAGTSIIDCKIPEVAAGEYTVEVRTKPTGKEIRTGRAKETLVIS